MPPITNPAPTIARTICTMKPQSMSTSELASGSDCLFGNTLAVGLSAHWRQDASRHILLMKTSNRGRKFRMKRRALMNGIGSRFQHASTTGQFGYSNAFSEWLAIWQFSTESPCERKTGSPFLPGIGSRMKCRPSGRCGLYFPIGHLEKVHSGESRPRRSEIPCQKFAVSIP